MTRTRQALPRHGIRCAGGSVFVWTAGPNAEKLANVYGLIDHGALRQVFGRELGYTLHVVPAVDRPGRVRVQYRPRGGQEPA